MKYTIDAHNKPLGRVATEVAAILNGKNTTDFAKNKVTEVTVEVINASSMRLTGNKMNDSVHKRYSGYPGGLKELTFKQVVAKKGYKELLTHAVNGMLPKNKLQSIRLKNLVITE
jgi:large subunit ribosomal protein L13